MKLLTQHQFDRLLANGEAEQRHGGTLTPDFVVKLFTPDGACTWLLPEIVPQEHDIAFGLCDLGMGFPELGCVRLSEIASLRGKLALPVERDLYWTPCASVTAYAEAAQGRLHSGTGKRGLAMSLPAYCIERIVCQRIAVEMR